MVLIAAGVPVLVHAFARFVSEGAGTPAPVAPTERLVVGGLYRYVRNPMYLAVEAVIVGQALLLNRPVLLAYALIVASRDGRRSCSCTRSRSSPDRYGAEYERYRRTVPGLDSTTLAPLGAGQRPQESR